MKTFYCNSSKDERLKTKKSISNNIDTFEIVFTPMHKLLDHLEYCYCLCNYICNCEEKCRCLYHQYCCENKNTLRCIVQVYHTVEHLKYLYLLQKCIKNNKYVFGPSLIQLKIYFQILILNYPLENKTIITNHFQLIQSPNTIIFV